MRQERSNKSGISRWNRFNLKFFGPPHVGHYEGPWEKLDPDPVCQFCQHRESEHLRDTNAEGKRFRRCPA